MYRSSLPQGPSDSWLSLTEGWRLRIRHWSLDSTAVLSSALMTYTFRLKWENLGNSQRDKDCSLGDSSFRTQVLGPQLKEFCSETFGAYIIQTPKFRKINKFRVAKNWVFRDLDLTQLWGATAGNIEENVALKKDRLHWESWLRHKQAVSSLWAADFLVIKWMVRQGRDSSDLLCRVTMKWEICEVQLKVIWSLTYYGFQILLNHNCSILSSLKMFCLINKMKAK